MSLSHIFSHNVIGCQRNVKIPIYLVYCDIRNTDLVYHLNGREISLSAGNLKLNSSQSSVAEDHLGSYVRLEQIWASDNLIFQTSVQSYTDTIIFTQHYPGGMNNVSLGNSLA